MYECKIKIVYGCGFLKFVMGFKINECYFFLLGKFEYLCYYVGMFVFFEIGFGNLWIMLCFNKIDRN